MAKKVVSVDNSDKQTVKIVPPPEKTAADKADTALDVAKIGAHAAITSATITSMNAFYGVLFVAIVGLIGSLSAAYLNTPAKESSNDIENIQAYNEQREGLVMQSFERAEEELQEAKTKLEQEQKDISGISDDLQLLDNSIAVVKKNRALVVEDYKQLYSALRKRNLLPVEMIKTDLNQTIINTQFDVNKLRETLKNTQVKPLIFYAGHGSFVKEDENKTLAAIDDAENIFFSELPPIGSEYKLVMTSKKKRVGIKDE